MRKRSIGTALGIVASLVLSLPATGARAQDPPPSTPGERAAAVVEPSVVFLLQDWVAYVRVPGRGTARGFVDDYVDLDDDFNADAFEFSTRCTGFIVNPNGYIMTAGHCVDDTFEGAKLTAAQIAIQGLIDAGIASEADFGSLLQEARGFWVVEGSNRDGPPDRTVRAFRAESAGGVTISSGGHPARVVDFTPLSQGDVALLKIEDSDLPALQLAPREEIAIGTEVLSVGYPGATDEVSDASFTPDFKNGQVSAERTREDGLLPVYEVSSALSGGMSGGPTVDLQGRVIGVNSYTISGETQAFNFISPSSLVDEMLSQNGVRNQLGDLDQTFRDGLNAYFEGEYEQAIERFDEVLGLIPTHAQAQEYKVKANRQLRLNPPSDFPLIPVIGGGVGLLVVIGLVLFFMSRRKKGGPPAVAAPQPQPTYAAAPSPPIPQPAPAPEPTVRMPEPAPAAVPSGPPTAPSAPPASAPTEPARSVGFRPPASVGEPTEPVTTGPAGSTDSGPSSATTDSERGFCSNCGMRLAPDARFCPRCGHQTS